ncbi:MAG: type I-E CRISPR-associated protein Cas6/Cse3/CasE [Richelia sp. RM2_1_2]|nr:type I-E CRISPR-associated protein Cas6/Cse3/CasE [Richelia sp. RM2_1_2]
MIEISISPDTFNSFLRKFMFSKVDYLYQIHLILVESMGSYLPPVWRLFKGGKVLGYSVYSADEIISNRCTNLNGVSIRTKDFVVTKQEIVFDAHAAPTGRTKFNGKQVERDVFLNHVDWCKVNNTIPLSREDVYKNFIQKKFQGIIDVSNMQLTHYSLDKVSRRRHQEGVHIRKDLKSVTIPNVVISGSGSITNINALYDCLINGISRHTDFGFGTLLLR